MRVPGPLRATVGLLATAADEAKTLPNRAVELPMRAISSVLQVSLRAQQSYARLSARGDELLNRRPASADPPPWATFDDPVPDAPSGTALPAEGAPAATPEAPPAPAERPAAVKAKPAASKAKTVNKPRHTSPSRFDAVGDD